MASSTRPGVRTSAPLKDDSAGVPLTKRLSGSTNLQSSKLPSKSSSSQLGSRQSLKGELDVKTAGCIEYRYIRSQDTEVHSVKFSPDDNYIACGLGTGDIKVYHAKTGEVVQSLAKADGLKVPCTAVVWRPHINSTAESTTSASSQPGIVSADNNANTTTNNVLLSCYPDGHIIQWHGTSGAILGRLDECDNQVLTIAYRRDALNFATAGSDCVVRVYDEETKSLSTAMSFGTKEVSSGHSNRIFCVKWHPKDLNVIVSGGWDSTLQFWDIRAGNSFRSIYKPYICGESIDFDDSGEKIVTGSYSKGVPLTVWSYATGEEIETLPWSLLDEHKGCLLYSASFSHSRVPTARNRLIVAGGGGGGTNEVKIFNHAARRCVGYISELSHAVFSAAISKDDKTLACGGSFNQLIVCDVDHNYQDELVY